MRVRIETKEKEVIVREDREKEGQFAKYVKVLTLQIDALDSQRRQKEDIIQDKEKKNNVKFVMADIVRKTVTDLQEKEKDQLITKIHITEHKTISKKSIIDPTAHIPELNT